MAKAHNVLNSLGFGGDIFIDSTAINASHTDNDDHLYSAGEWLSVFEALEKEPKSIDNTLTRIRLKAKAITK